MTAPKPEITPCPIATTPFHPNFTRNEPEFSPFSISNYLKSSKFQDSKKSTQYSSSSFKVPEFHFQSSKVQRNRPSSIVQTSKFQNFKGWLAIAKLKPLSLFISLF